MADVKPEVHLDTEVEGLLEGVQRLPAHFRLRLSTGDSADIVQHYNKHCSTSDSVGSMTGESGVVENVGVAIGIFLISKSSPET